MTDWKTEDGLKKVVDKALEGFLDNQTFKGRSFKEADVTRLRQHLINHLSERIENLEDAYVEELEKEVDELRQEAEMVSGPRADLLEEWRLARNVIKLLLYAYGDDQDGFVTTADQINKFSDVELDFRDHKDGILIYAEEPMDEEL